MEYNKHYDLIGKHADLSPSSASTWFNYDDDKLKATTINLAAKKRGTELHDFASRAIKLGQRLEDAPKTLNMFVNDAIYYKMESELPLFYSDICFGTADAIIYNDRDHLLRVHDLKTGITPAHMEQLEAYAALFCLEYRMKPDTMIFELRIYQNDEVMVYNPEHTVISDRMKTIRHHSKLVASVKKEYQI